MQQQKQKRSHTWQGPHASVLAQQVAPGGKYANEFGHRIMEGIKARGTVPSAIYTTLLHINNRTFYDAMRLQQRRPLSDSQIFEIADFLQIDALDLLRPYHNLPPEQEIYSELAYVYQAYPRRSESIRAGVRLLVRSSHKYQICQLPVSLPKSRYTRQLESGVLLSQVSPGGFYENLFGQRVLAAIQAQQTTLRATRRALGMGEEVFNDVLCGVAYTLSDAQIFHLAEILALPPLRLLLPYHGIQEETGEMAEELAWLLCEYPRCDETIRQGVRALLRGSPAVHPYWGVPRLGKLKAVRQKKQG